MLTLNTNAWWNWGYSLSNKEVSTAYPQIEENILLLPKIDWQFGMNSLPTAFEVNWTPVHFVNDTFIAPNNLSCGYWNTIYNWSTYLFPPCNLITLQYTNPAILRFWLFEPLQAWMTIWKTIVLPPLYQWWTSSYIHSSMKLKVWVLHTDWTITYLAEQTLSKQSVYVWNLPNSSTRWSSVVYLYQFWTFQVVNTNWYTTVEWDRVIAEIETLETTQNVIQFIVLWSEFPIYASTKKQPIQISID